MLNTLSGVSGVLFRSQEWKEEATERKVEMEEVFVAMKLVFSVAVVGVLSWILYVYGSLWLESQRVRKRIQMQGIKGPPPSFLHGNLSDMQRIQAQASLAKASISTSNGSDQYVAHDCTATLFPYFEHWRKQYGTLLFFSFYFVLINLNQSFWIISKQIWCWGCWSLSNLLKISAWF